MDSNLFSLVVPKLAYSSRFHYAKNQLKINRHILVEMKKKLKKIYMSSITNSLILQKCAAVLLMSVCFITHEKEAKNCFVVYCSGLFFLEFFQKNLLLYCQISWQRISAGFFCILYIFCLICILFVTSRRQICAIDSIQNYFSIALGF